MIAFATEIRHRLSTLEAGVAKVPEGKGLEEWIGFLDERCAYIENRLTGIEQSLELIFKKLSISLPASDANAQRMMAELSAKK